MIFIFGSPRSGTTLLAQSLNAHSDIVVPHESDFLIPVAHIFDRIKDADTGREMIAKIIINTNYFKQGWSLNGYLSENEIKDVVYSCKYSLSEIFDSLYNAVASKAGKKIAGDKSPNDLLGLRILVQRNAFSEKSRILHIVRDIRDVMVSLNGLGWVGDLDLYFPRFWCDTNLYLHSLFKSESDRYCFVRYEDIVIDPEKVFSKICHFLGVMFQPEMLLPSNRHPRYREMHNHQNIFKPISADKVGYYTCRLSKMEQNNILLQAKEGLEKFNYL